jgi:hypothetical protein
VFRASQSDLQANGDGGRECRKTWQSATSISGEQDIIPLADRAIFEMLVKDFSESWPFEL